MRGGVAAGATSRTPLTWPEGAAHELQPPAAASRCLILSQGKPCWERVKHVQQVHDKKWNARQTVVFQSPPFHDSANQI